MIGMRSGMGTKYGADTADPGSMGKLKSGAPVKRARKAPANIKGMAKKKRPTKKPPTNLKK